MCAFIKSSSRFIRLSVIATLTQLAFTSAAHADNPPDLRVRASASKRTLTLEYGPVQLPAGVAYGGTLVPVSVAAPIPVNGWLRGFEVTVLGGNGQPLKQPLLHHAGLFAPDQRDLFNAAMRRIVAFGSETAPIRLPGELGYRVQPGDSVLLLAALYNPTGRSFDSVSLRVTISYADARTDVAHQDVLPLYLDVLPPGDRVYDVPPGDSQRSFDWSPAISGRVLAFGGHLHQYGESVMLEDVTTGDTLWIGRALYDARGNLSGIDRKIFLRGLQLRADHSYRITARYRNPTNQTIRGAMGKIGGLFIPDAQQVMPGVDRSNADYMRDLDAMLHHKHEADHVRAEEQHGRH